MVNYYNPATEGASHQPKFDVNKDVVIEKLFQSVNTEAVENTLEHNGSGKPP